MIFVESCDVYSILEASIIYANIYVVPLKCNVALAHMSRFARDRVIAN